MTAIVTPDMLDKVDGALVNAKGIAWDGCHKIYILLDDEQMKLMQEYGYDPLIPVETDQDKVHAFDTLIDWFGRSCSLRFISSVSTNLEDPNAGFTRVIAQFEADVEPEEDL